MNKTQKRRLKDEKKEGGQDCVVHVGSTFSGIVCHDVQRIGEVRSEHAE